MSGFQRQQQQEPAIIYARKSNLTNGQTEGNNLSLEGQIYYSQQYAKKHNLNVIETITEVNSAYKSCPQKLKSLITPEYAGFHILVYAIDRFSRNTDIGYPLLKTAKKLGIVFHFVSEEFRSDNERHILSIKTDILKAENESRIIGIRIKMANYVRRSRGHYIGSNPGYGYQVKTVNGIKKKLPKAGKEYLILQFILEASKEIVNLDNLNFLIKKIVGVSNFEPIIVEDETDETLTLSTGYINTLSNSNIKTLLNDYNILNKYGAKWTTSQVRNIIKNRVKTEANITDTLSKMTM